MRQAYAHDAVLDMAEDADMHAPGAAITTQLCGHWRHEPPCPVAPHHTHAERANGQVRLRMLFAAEPELEDTVRQGMDLVLSRGHWSGPDGAITRWRLLVSRRAEVSVEEADHADRLRRG